MDVTPALKTVLKRLKLSGVLPTLPDRIAYARQSKLSELQFLELALQDEIDRRDHHNLTQRLTRAGFEEEQTLEAFDWDAPITCDRDRVRDLFGLGFVARQEDVIFLGPVGVGKTFLACALGHAACRAGHDVLFLRADRLFQLLLQARADHSTDKAVRRLLTPDVLIVDVSSRRSRAGNGRPCGRSPSAGRPPWAAISTWARRAASNDPPTTRVAIGTVRSVSAARKRAGSSSAWRASSTSTTSTASAHCRRRCVH